MSSSAYTLAKYRVKPGQETRFIEEWHNLARTFSSLSAPPQWGTLIRSVTDRTLFYSFGPWRDAADVAAMRGSESARKAFARLGALCSEIMPGDYELIEHVEVEGRKDI